MALTEVYEPLFTNKGWFDPTLDLPGWFSDDFATQGPVNYQAAISEGASAATAFVALAHFISALDHTNVAPAVAYVPSAHFPVSLTDAVTAAASAAASIHAAAAIAEGRFAPGVVTFDQTNDYAVHTGGLSGVSDSEFGFCSFYFTPHADCDGVQVPIFTSRNAATAKVQVYKDSDDRITVILGDGGNFLVFKSDQDFPIQSAGGRRHIMASWDTNHAANAKISYLYVDDADLRQAVPTDDDAAFQTAYSSGTITHWDFHNFNSDRTGTFDIAEFYFDTVNFFDLSNSANRRKFINADLSPVDALAPGGQYAPGSTPAVAFACRNAGSPDSFATNLGTGGSFTLTGSLALAGLLGSSPDDYSVLLRYGAVLTEAVTAAASKTTQLRAVADLANAATAGSTFVSLAHFISSLTEAATAGATQAALAHFISSLTNAVTAGATQDGAKTISGAVSEAVTAAASQATGLRAQAALSEAASAAVTYASLLRALAAVSEAAAPAATQVAITHAGAALLAAATAGDTTAALTHAAAVLANAVTAGASQAALTHAAAPITEAITAAMALNTRLGAVAALAAAAAAGDSATARLIAQASLANAVSAACAQAAAVHMPVACSEPASLGMVLATRLSAVASLSEAVVAGFADSAPAQGMAELSEAVTLGCGFASRLAAQAAASYAASAGASQAAVTRVRVDLTEAISPAAIQASIAIMQALQAEAATLGADAIANANYRSDVTFSITLGDGDDAQLRAALIDEALTLSVVYKDYRITATLEPRDAGWVASGKPKEVAAASSAETWSAPSGAKSWQ